MHACTIIAKNYVAYARVLARSFAEHQPDAHFTVLIVDDFDGYIDPAAEPFEVLTPAQIGCEPFESMAARYDVLELSTAVKPWLLRHLLRRGAPAVTYLDPDIQVFGSLTRLDELGQVHGLALTPHNTVPIPSDGERPTQVDIMISGAFNLGYVTIAPRPDNDRLLDWWSDRLERDCRVDPIYGYFVDQRWMDLVSGLVTDYAVIRDPEFNVAYWNLHARELQHDRDGYTVDGRPLAFFHFSGFDPERPTELSRHQTRVNLADSPALTLICEQYAAAVQAADATPFTPTLRKLYGEAEARGELHATPFSDEGQAAFAQWLRGHEPGSPAGITRLLDQIHRERSDLQSAFPDIAGNDRLAFLKWAREVGVAELGLPDSLLPAEAETGPSLPEQVGSFPLPRLPRRDRWGSMSSAPSSPPSEWAEPRVSWSMRSIAPACPCFAYTDRRPPPTAIASNTATTVSPATR
jgi:hypothetical protein